MMTPTTRPSRRPNMRRAVVLFPSGLTLGNLFFGVFAIITASRGDFRMAGIWVLWGGLCDVFDGRIARAANAGTEFGEELDSLVDAISFGLAPAMIMYFAVLNRDGWDWIFVFLFAACAVMRLARFNIEQAGTAKTYFQGLPSPAAGITLASYYWFSQSWLYSYGAIGDLPWQELLRFLMAALAFLMISNIPYPVVPRVGFRSLRAIGASILIFGSLALLATKRLEFFFPLCIGYVAFGLVRSLFFRLFERRQPTIPYDLSEGEDDEEEEDEDEDIGSAVHLQRQGHRERPSRSDRTKVARHATEPKDATSTSAERSSRPDRAERPDRGERPQRTDAERAARREKREKRDKRDKREERGPRPPRAERVAETSPAVESSADTESEEVIGAIPSAEDAGGPSREGAPPRKRKRRRRRGERGPRDNAESGSGDEGAQGGDDAGFEPSSSPAANDFTPLPSPLPPPAPSPAASAAPAPAPPPSPYSDSQE